MFRLPRSPLLAVLVVILWWPIAFTFWLLRGVGLLLLLGITFLVLPFWVISRH